MADKEPVRWITVKGARIPVFADGSIGVGKKEEDVKHKSKEKEIYDNMRKKGRIYKKQNGKYGIDYSKLFVAIKEAGYNDEMVEKIIKNMIDKGYLSKSNDRYNKGLRYIIEKWVND